MKRFVYADNAATTPVACEVVEAMTEFFTDKWGNPSSLYSKGSEAKEALEEARAKIASLLGCDAPEIFFTSCGSESDNWAIKGVAYANEKKGRHIVCSAYEHHAVVNTMKYLTKQGFEVSYVQPTKEGYITPEAVEKEIKDDTTLVCVMFANNEIGTVNDVKELARVAHKHGAIFFTDGVQATGHIPFDLKDLDVDLLSFSGHKFNAPKGVGGLYIKKGTKIDTFLHGGGQEKRKRGGTENLPYIIGMARALELAHENFKDNDRITAMRNRLVEGISKIPYSIINGSMDNHLPGTVNAAFEFIEGESLMLLLDLEGICVSTGSACSSDSLQPSHVLLSIGLPVEKAHGSLRFSLSHLNTDEDVDYILEVLPKVVKKLRMMSPLYDGSKM